MAHSPSLLWPRTPRQARRGSIIVLAAVLMIGLLGVIAFAVDLGLILVVRTELQRTADAAAMAGAWKLVEDNSPRLSEQDARIIAQQFAERNSVLRSSPQLRENASNSRDGDIVVGHLAGFGNPEAELSFEDADAFNAVQVRVRRNADVNGEIPLFFARALGLDKCAVEATATAAVMRRIGGFRAPKSGDNLPFLPITLHEDAWQGLFNGSETPDQWAFNEDGSVSHGSDGVPELKLYPEDTNSPGNFGTVDIGPTSNSTSNLSHQIANGISEADLSYHGGELKLDDQGVLNLGGDTGISAGIKDELAAIIGQKRIIPLYRSVSGTGNTAEYTIVKFVGVRIMEVQLTGGDKRLYLQPADIIVQGTLPTDRDDTSQYIRSPAHLVR